MKLIDKLLRLPLAPEVLALLEKIDSIDSIYDASYYPIKKLLHIDGFSRYERMMLVRSFIKIDKRYAYSCAMHVVVKNELPEEPMRPLKNGGILTRASMANLAKQELEKAYAAQQASTLTNGGLASLTNPHQGLYASGLTDTRDYYRNVQQ